MFYILANWIFDWVSYKGLCSSWKSFQKPPLNNSPLRRLRTYILTNGTISIITTNNTNGSINIITTNNTHGTINIITTNNIDGSISIITTNNTDCTISIITVRMYDFKLEGVNGLKRIFANF